MKITCDGAPAPLVALVVLLLLSVSLSATVTNAFVVSPAPTSTSTGTRHGAASSSTTTTRLKAAALIIQNKGGGHGELGYQLAKVLLQDNKIEKITILQDDDADFATSEPFLSYAHDLAPHGVVINTIPMTATATGDDLAFIDATFIQNMLGGREEKYEYVFDNCSKKPEGVAKAIVDCVASWKDNEEAMYCQLYAYVSSAGMYLPTPDTTFPMAEDTTPIKETSGQHLFDDYVATVKQLPLVSFRPQYIYGPKSNKHTYLDYYFDQLCASSSDSEAKKTIALPGDGTQLVSLTNAADVATLIAAPLTTPAILQAAIQQRYFNCGTDQLVSYTDVGYLCADAAQIPRDQVQFRYETTKDEKPKGFPFRPTNFYVAPETAKALLQWPGAQHSLQQDLNEWYYAGYRVRNGL